jgi:hypothetical protein
MRDLAQVFAHMHGQVPLDLTDRPDPKCIENSDPSRASCPSAKKFKGVRREKT